MNDESAVRYTRDNLPESRTDWAQLRALTEEEIEAKALSDSDSPPWTEEELRNAALVMPEERTKVPISIRLDADVLEFFKASGPRYQGRINAVLRSYVRSKRRQA